jgi:hypothetical protein
MPQSNAINQPALLTLIDERAGPSEWRLPLIRKG